MVNAAVNIIVWSVRKPTHFFLIHRRQIVEHRNPTTMQRPIHTGPTEATSSRPIHYRATPKEQSRPIHHRAKPIDPSRPIHRATPQSCHQRFRNQPRIPAPSPYLINGAHLEALNLDRGNMKPGQCCETWDHQSWATPHRCSLMS